MREDKMKRWKKYNSHYSQKYEGKKISYTNFYYAEWEQKGNEIKNHRIYKMEW